MQRPQHNTLRVITADVEVSASAFRRALPDLLETDQGRWVVFSKGAKWSEPYDSRAEAKADAVATFGEDGPFSVYLIAPPGEEADWNGDPMWHQVREPGA